MLRRQTGVTLIEVLAVMGIAALLLAGISGMIDDSLDEVKSGQAARYQAQVVQAATRYIDENYTTLSAPALVGVTTAYSLATLSAAGVMPPGAGDLNVYGQSTCLLVRPRTKTVGPLIVTVIDAVVVTEGTAAQRILEKELPFAAASAGHGGGFISTTAPALAQSSSRAWKLDAGTSPSLAQFQGARCSGNTFGAGSLVSALFFDHPGQPSSDFLYRNKVNGFPGLALNTMNTPIGMGAGAVVAGGAACDGSAALAVDAQRYMMHCHEDGHWRRVGSASWKDPVTDFAALDALAGSLAGDVRMVLSVNRAFTLSSAGTWEGLSVDRAGSMHVPNDVVAGRDVRAGGELAVAGNASVAGNATVSGDLAVVRNARVGSDLWVEGEADVGVLHAREFTSTPVVMLRSQASVGAVCHTPGVDSKGNPIIINPIGMIIQEATASPRPVTLVCSGTGVGDAYFTYMNGLATR